MEMCESQEKQSLIEIFYWRWLNDELIRIYWDIMFFGI